MATGNNSNKNLDGWPRVLYKTMNDVVSTKNPDLGRKGQILRITENKRMTHTECDNSASGA